MVDSVNGPAHKRRRMKPRKPSPDGSAASGTAASRGKLTYEKVADYHLRLRQGEPATISARGKSRCDSEITLEVAQALLDDGYPHKTGGDGLPKQVFAQFKGVWYRALSHGRARYHGAPIEKRRVPPEALRRKEKT